MKKLFMTEIEKIIDPKLKRAAKQMVKDAPEYFWKIPASSSGKYHPKCDLGDGGLVRHSIMVSKVADDIITAEIFCRDTQENRDIVRVATLFHDFYKNGEANNLGEYGTTTVHTHPIIAANFVEEHLKIAKVDTFKIDIICDCIRTHMGKWCASKYSSVVLDTPKTDFERLVHTADYIASRKYIAGLDEWKTEK